jgi:type I restriction enzyme S subunit
MIEGYKETKIGILPNNWNVVKQSDVATFYNGRAYKLTEWETDGIPVIRLQNLTGTGKDYYYSKLNLPEHQYCYKDDLLYMWSATFGPVWWFGEKAIFHYHIWKIEHDSQLLDRYFHYYLLDDVTVRMKNESHGSTMLHVTKGGMEKLLIQLPPLPEQQKIAEILSTVDDKIEVIDQQIIETQALKKGLMQRLLTKGIGHTEFKDSPLGMIPKSWKVSKISEIADINKRSLPNTTDDDFEFYYIDLSAVKSGTIEFPTEKVLFSNSPSRARRILRHGDVIMATVRPNLLGIGFADFKTDDFICSTGFALISHKENSDGKYIYQNLYSENVQSQINKLIVGSNYPAINSSDVQNIKIPMPPLSEQQKIAEILSSVDDKLEVLSEKKTHYQELKQGLMQQLLTGKIRVKV